MLDVVYRFRSIDKLLEHRELERRQIYLAPPEKLNDPMEGYKDVLWRGDAILWENLVRHYLLALLMGASQCVLAPPGRFAEPKIWAGWTEEDLPTDAFRGLYAEVCDDFSRRIDGAPLYTHLLALDRPLRREGIRFVLWMFHSTALLAVSSTLEKHGLSRSSLDGRLSTSAELKQMIALLSKNLSTSESGDLELLAASFNRVRQEQMLRLAFDLERTQPDKDAREKFRYLVADFVDRYVLTVVEGLIHPAWRTACFTATCTNASNWASYGDQHCGVALVFRPAFDGGQPFLPLSGVTGISGGVGQPDRLMRGPLKGLLRRVVYTNRPPEIDFFRSLGNLPRARVARIWHTNRSGERSTFIDENVGTPAWREAYWASFQNVMTTKLEDWKHEEEYRIVQPDLLGLGESSALVEYEFSNLVGVVFGLRTTHAHKIEIMKQILPQCERAGRTDFEFFQMAYDPVTGRLVRQ